MTDVIKDQNIGEFTSVKPLSGVVWGFDPFIQSVLFIEPLTFSCARGAYPYICFRYVTVSSYGQQAPVFSVVVIMA